MEVSVRELHQGLGVSMARIASNGAIISDNGGWYWDGWKWVGLVSNPTEKAPGMFSTKRLTLVNQVKGKSMPEMKKREPNWRV